MTNTSESAQTLPTPADEQQDLTRYVATINVPGYSPMADELATFATAEDAWSYLADERERAEDETDDESAEYSRTLRALRALASEAPSVNRAHLDSSMVNPDRTGTVYGATPGYDGGHDLGLAYSVAVLEHVNYPHKPGYLYDCAACEAGPCVCANDATVSPCLSSECERR